MPSELRQQIGSCGRQGVALLELIRPGEPHTLRAELDVESATLRVVADGVAAWEGLLPRTALDFDGPAGIRSDNGEFDFAVRVPPASRLDASCQETRAATPD